MSDKIILLLLKMVDNIKKKECFFKCNLMKFTDEFYELVTLFRNKIIWKHIILVMLNTQIKPNFLYKVTYNWRRAENVTVEILH